MNRFSLTLVTFSILAVDNEAQEIGVAVCSHWLGVGSIVPRIRAGVGAAVSQSVSDPALSVALLDAVERGRAPVEAIADVVSRDSARAFRQLAVIDVSGATAAHTGAGCVRFAGHEAASGLSVQGNLLASADVLPAMSAAFAGAAGPLGRRLLSALLAAQGIGGDVRGRQSAGLLVAPMGGEGWRTLIDLRVDDHADPLAELGRLHDLRDAYAAAKRGDERAAASDASAAIEHYLAAAELAPQSAELLLWAGLALVGSGARDAGMSRVRDALDRQPALGELLRRLDPEMAPAAPEVRLALDLPSDASGGSQSGYGDSKAI